MGTSHSKTALSAVCLECIITCEFAKEVWLRSEVPVFLERFLLVVLATAFWQIVMSNAMKLDIHYRIGIGIVLIGLAYITAHAVYKNKPKTDAARSAATLTAPRSSANNPKSADEKASTGSATATGTNVVANTGNSATISNGTSPPKDENNKATH